ncbi:outer membrane beta-barrel protein [Roseivirga sp. BDSF3-8]|uniref:outer membrane beta-barrel protein n=1 Tax=Roseivirga sp. BDSF3-8 TaxID=3241598 RepID=UPI00353259CA
MRSLIIFITAVLTSIQVLAQDVRLGIRGGGSFANQELQSDALGAADLSYDPESRLGWEVGLVMDASISQVFAFQPAILLSSKGYRYEETNVLFELDIESRPLYVQLPMPFIIRSAPGPIRFLAGAGPYVAYGVGGNIESEGVSGGVEFLSEGDIEWGDDIEDNYRPFDAGAYFMAGFEVSNLQLTVNYELGLANILPQGDDNNYVHNRVLSAGVTFFIP